MSTDWLREALGWHFRHPQVGNYIPRRLVSIQRDRHRLHGSRFPLAECLDRGFNGRLRDEYLNGQLFETLFEAQVLLEDWRID